MFFPFQISVTLKFLIYDWGIWFWKFDAFIRLSKYGLLGYCVWCVLATSKVILGQVSSCDSAQRSRLYSDATLGDQAASTTNWYPSQSIFPDTEPTSHCLILLKPSSWIASYKCQFFSHWLTRPGNELPISRMRGCMVCACCLLIGSQAKCTCWLVHRLGADWVTCRVLIGSQAR